MRAKLLLADDSVTIQRVIELTFADEDMQVFTVGDGRAAIEQIQRERPDIILADAGMPERDGYEVAAFVKGTPALSGIPVLLLTGAFEPVDEARARAVGCDGVLVKPFEPQMVINRVRDLLAGRRPEGLWHAASAATPARSAPSIDVDLRGVASPPPAVPSGSLEDYFDRLDAAFATLEGGTLQGVPAPAAAEPRVPESRGPVQGQGGGLPPASTEFSDDLGRWDPDFTPDAGAGAGDASPARLAAQRLPPAPSPASAPPPSASGGAAASTGGTRREVPAAAPPTLGEAFAALLSAEQGQSFGPGTPRAPVAVAPEAVDEAVRRVLEGLTAQSVRELVLDVAERLVREEIARIKAAAPPSA
jgi:CheY-like chemotaxis protein